MTKRRGVLLRYTCSTMSYERGSKIASGTRNFMPPDAAQLALDGFYKIASRLIDEARKADKAVRGSKEQG